MLLILSSPTIKAFEEIPFSDLESAREYIRINFPNSTYIDPPGTGRGSILTARGEVLKLLPSG